MKCGKKKKKKLCICRVRSCCPAAWLHVSLLFDFCALRNAPINAASNCTTTKKKKRKRKKENTTRPLPEEGGIHATKGLTCHDHLSPNLWNKNRNKRLCFCFKHPRPPRGTKLPLVHLQGILRRHHPCPRARRCPNDQCLSSSDPPWRQVCGSARVPAS